jgi:hypothetical protein
LQVRDLHWSEGLSRQAVWLSGIVAFGDASDILKDVGQVNISKSSVWRLAQVWGEKYQVEEKRQTEAANTIPGREQIIPGEEMGRERLGASMDGALMYILEEGWKEFKIGTVFKVETKSVLDKTTLEEEPVGCARDVSYVAHLGGPELFGKLHWAEAKKRGWTKAVDTQVVADAAAWIWNLANEHFYDSYHLVDWYHATEHLAKAAEYLYGQEETSSKQQFLNEQKRFLFQGHAEEIAITLQQKAQTSCSVNEGLLKEAGYFENQKRRMNYLEMRTEGWLIGSGTVESGAKQYKERFTGPGMRWKRSHAECLLPVRSAIMTGNFYQSWHALYYSPRN